MKKSLALLLTAALLCGCATGPANSAVSSETASSIVSEENLSPQDKDFNDFMHDYVVETCELDYTTAHHYFEDPAKAGIDLSKCEITLGTILPDEQQEQFEDETLSRLKEFSTQDLSKANKQLCEQLLWENDLALRQSDSRFNYLDNIWSEMSGTQTAIPDFFTEYQLFGESDLEPLIELINDVPRYTDEAIAYTKEQAKRGLLSFDYEATIEKIDEILDSKANSITLSELEAEIDTLDISSSKKSEWKNKVREAMDESFFPSFEKMKSALAEVEDQNQPLSGLASHDNGADYYALLLEYYCGGPVGDLEDLQEELLDKLNATLDDFQALQEKNPKAALMGMSAKTDFTKVSDIMPFLDEHYAMKFPVLEAMDYEIKPLSKEQSNEGVLAYFVVPPIDSNRTYEIRYNAEDYADDPSDLQLYDTFAHEGIPGHMYQTQYNKEHLSVAQHFQDSMGFQEGYATYAAWHMLDDAGVDPDILESWKLNSLYTNYLAMIMDIDINGFGMSQDEFAEVYGEALEPLYNQLAQNPGIFFAYYYGFDQFETFFNETKEELGDKFDEPSFNNALLEAGTVKFSIVEDNLQEYIDSVK